MNMGADEQPESDRKGGLPRAGQVTLSMPRPRIRLEDLLGGGEEVVIAHGAKEYLLRITKNGKLILTK